MYKRDRVEIVFRIAAVLFLFVIIIKLPEIISVWTESVVTLSISSKIFQTVLLVGVPLGSCLFLWNRSEWVADRVLAPFKINESGNIDSAKEIAVEEIPEQEISIDSEALNISDFTKEAITADEILTIALCIIAVWLFISSIPELLSEISIAFIFGSISSSLTNSTPFRYFWPILPPLCKMLLSAWLLFRMNTLVAWLSRQRS